MDPITGLATGRIALGATTLLSPALASKLFLLDAKGNPQLPYMARLFASREIILGAITLAATGGSRRKLVQMGIAVDGSDAFASLAATRSGALSKPAGLCLTLVALTAVGAGVAGLNDAD